MNTNDKIKKLTDQIYREGVEKANSEAEQIIAKAKEQANSIVNDAKVQGDAVIELAKKQADELKSNITSEMRLAAQQFTSNLKNEIHKKVINTQVEAPVKEALEDKEFMQKMVLALIDKWSPKNSEQANIKLLLPEKKEKELSDFFNAKAVEVLNSGLEINFSPTIQSGFKIEPKESNYQIDFTNEGFESYFKSYLKDKTKKMIFN